MPSTEGEKKMGISETFSGGWEWKFLEHYLGTHEWSGVGVGSGFLLWNIEATNSLRQRNE